MIVALSWVVISGCASNELQPFEADPVVRDIAASAEGPMPLSLALAPIRIDFDRGEVNQEGSNRYAVKFDPRDLREEFAEVLRTYNVFERVDTVEGESAAECIDNAFEDHFDLVMEMNLKQFDVNYDGVNGWYAPNLINFALFIWTAWWVADEIYAANVEMEMTLYSAHSGQALIAPLLFKEQEKRELDDFERGWKLTGSIFIPSGLKPENWQKIHDVVMPFTLQKVKREVLSTMHNDIRQYSGDQDFADAMSKRMAVVVGVTRHDAFLIHNLRYADADARDFTEFLTDPYRADVPPKNVQTFENHTATLQNVRDAFQKVADYCREDDTVIVYFAGYGAVTKDDFTGGDGFKKYLVMADTDVDKLSESALGLDELDQICDSLPAQNVLIILDTSFNQPGESRTFVDVRKPSEEITLTDGYLKALTDGPPGRIVLAACQPDQGALMLDEEEQGLLTHYLLEGTQPGQIPDDDAILTLQEVLDYALPAAEDRADIEGQPQSPVVIKGEGAKEIPFVFHRTYEEPPEEEMPPEEGMGDGGE